MLDARDPSSSRDCYTMPRMKIVWKKANWISLTIAIILFVSIFLLGMKLGAQKQKIFDRTGSAPSPAATIR